MNQYIFIQESELRDLVSESIRKELESFKPVPASNESELITRTEAARLLDISLPTLNAYSKDGRIKSYRIGSRIRYKRDEVLKSLQEVKTFKYKSHV